MLAFVVRRIAQAALVMLVVAFIAFALFQYVGDPVLSMLGQDATPEQRAELRRDLGLSYRQGRKVSTLIRERFPATLELSFAAALLALAIVVPLGVYTALRRRGVLSNLLLAASLVGVS